MFRALLLTLIFSALSLMHLPASAQPSEHVTAGVYINDILNIDIKTHSFAADIYIWFRWKDARLNPAESLEFLNPSELWGHSRSFSFDKPLIMPNGERYQVLRTQGHFSHKFALDHYPFDRQTLHIEFEDKGLTKAGLRYVADTAPITVNPSLRIPGFRVGQAALDIITQAYPTRFGDLRENAEGKGTEYSRMRVQLPISRPVITYCIKLLTPVLCVVFCAALIFFFNPTYVDSRVGIGITALLTIVALQITLNEDLPEIDYPILMDKIYLTSYLFVIAALGVIVRTTWMLDRGSTDRAVTLNKRALLVLISLYFITVSSFIVSAAVFG